MSANPTFSTHDLRSAAVDYNRDHEQKHKWAYGQAWGPGRRETEGHARPARPATHDSSHERRDGVPIATHKARARQGRRRDISADYSSSGDSDDNAVLEVEEPSAAPAPDADVAYSFDAPRGPGEGSQVLSTALDRAIERFEVRATDKLINDEYEVLDSNGETVARRAAGKGKKRGSASAAEDEEFEIV